MWQIKGTIEHEQLNSNLHLGLHLLFESPTFMCFHEKKTLILYAISACILCEENAMIL